MSPFSCKLETYLKMAGIDYKRAPANWIKAPKGRVPYVKIDSEYMGDSSLIVEKLKARNGDPLDGHLTRQQRAIGIAVQRLVEEHLFFAAAYLRWADDVSWPYVREVLMPMLPPVLGGLIAKQIRKSFLKDIETQGIGQHGREEIIEFAKADTTALSDLLGDKPFILSDEPSSFDATLYGFLIQQLWVPWDSPLKQYGLAHKNLVAYCERMKKRYWA